MTCRYGDDDYHNVGNDDDAVADDGDGDGDGDGDHDDGGGWW